jgi:acetate kinase
MAASLGGVDVIALTGGIGEHDDQLTSELEQALAWLGPVRWLRIPANEEGTMTRQCLGAQA